MQQQNQQKLAESQQKLNQATNDLNRAMQSIYQQQAAAEENRRIREEEAERQRIEQEQRERRERAEKAERERIEREKREQHAAYVSGKRSALASDFKDGKIPVGADNVSADELWFFAWQGGGAQASVTNVFPIARYNDGSYPFKNNIVSEISKAGISGTVNIVGWFNSYEEAQQAKNRFLQTAREGEMTVKEINYKGKPKTTGNTTKQGDDFWGTGAAKTTPPANDSKKSNSFWD